MATANHNTALVLQIPGAPSMVLKRGEKTTVPAKAGQRYRVVKEDKDAPKEAAKEAAKDVAASQQGQDLLLSYADGTQVVLQNFYEACKAEQCAVDMPGAQGTGVSGGYVITGDSPVGASLSGGGQLVYAYGDTSALNALTQGQGQGAGFVQQGGLSTYVPSSSGTLWTPLNVGLTALGAAVLLQSDEKAAPVPTVIRGSVVAGPVVEGNSLTAVAYKADGSVLASSAVGADGTFTLTVGNDYKGSLLVKVGDIDPDPLNRTYDYFDEATDAPKDLTTDLRALTVIPAAGTYNISVNVLTELAVRYLGLSGGDTGNSSVNFSSLSSTQITQSNQKVAAAVGLTQDLVTGASPVAIVTTDGSSNAQSNDYGRLLAALSGAEMGSNTNAVLVDLTDKLQSSQAQATGQVLERLLEGAAVPRLNLVAAISDITNQKSTVITINAVSQDNRLSPAEMMAGVQVQGTAAVGASVSITWSDSSGTATATGTRTVTADSQGHWSTSFTSEEMPALGATTLKATVGSDVATRSIYLDEQQAPTITLTQMTGSGILTRNGQVDVSGILSGAGWDYSLDGGANWTAGSGSGFTATGDGAKQVMVRQNISGHTSPSSNTLNFLLDTATPAVTLSAATDDVGSVTGPVASGSSTNDTALVLSGTNEAGATVAVYNGTTLLGAATVTGTNWTYSATVANGSTYQFNATATDAAGNTSAATANHTVIGDTAAPAVTLSAATDDVGSVTGPVTSGSSTDDTALVLSGTNEAGATVAVYNGTTLLGAATVTGTNWTYSATVANGSTYQFNATATDAAGNTSAATTNHTVIGDTAAPAVTLSAATDDVGSVTGPVTSSSSTDDNALVLSGTNEAGATVAVYNGTTLLGAATVTGTNWTYSATVANGSTYQFNATATDAAGNTSAATTNHTVIGDTAAPAVTLSAATDDVGSVTGPVTSGNSTDDNALVLSGTNEAGATVAVYNGTTLLGAATVTGTNWTYSATVANGSTYQFNATATDAAGNTSAATANHTVIGDSAEPTVTITSSATSLTANATATLTFTLSEAIANFSDANVTVTGGTLSNFAGSGTSYTATFTPDVGLSGSATISVAANVLTDAAGNSNSAASNTVSIDVDTQAPMVASITSNDSTLSVGQVASLSIALSEDSSNFGLADLQVVGGTLSNFSGSGRSYSAVFTPDDNRTDAGSVLITTRSFSDAAGNDSQRSDNDGVVLGIHTLRPTVEIMPRQFKLGMGDISVIDITLSEKSADFTVADLTVSHGTLSDFTPLGDGIHYSVVFTPEANYTGDGNIAVTGGSFTNASGNSNLSMLSPLMAIDTTPPTVTITSDKAALAIGQSASITFTFNKDPGDSFDANDITVNGGTLSKLTNNTGKIWTAVFTPTDGSTGQASINVSAGLYKDAAGNKGTEGTTPSITIDTQGPVADSLLPGNATTVLPGHDLVLTFSEAVHKGTGNLVLVDDTAGTRTTLAVTDPAAVLSGDGKTLTITPSTTLVAGNEYHVEAAPGTLLDAAGNAWAGIAPSSTWVGSNWHFKAATPSVSLNKISTDNRVNGTENTAVVTVSGLLNSETLAVVQAFQAGDFTVTLTQGGISIPVTVNSYVVTNGVGAWSGTTAAGAFTQNGTYSVNVTASRVISSSTVSAQTTGSVLVDLSVAAPTMALLKDTGSSDSDRITSQAIVSVSGLEEGATWLYLDDDGWHDGTGNSFEFSGGGASARILRVRQTDAVGNFSGDGTLNVTFDPIAENPIFNTIATNDIINASELSSAITGTAEAGASVTLTMGSSQSGGATGGLDTGASSSNARTVTVTADSSGNWSYTLTDADVAALGSGQTQISAQQMDKAGNLSYKEIRRVTVDAVTPTVTIEAAQTTLRADNASTTLTFTLSEKSTDFTASSVTVTGGTLSNFAGSGTTYTATFTPTNAATTAGSVKVAAGVFSDAAGNTNAEASNTIELSVDTVRPTVLVSSDLTTLTAGQEALLTFTLSEASDSFSADSITVEGGTLGKLSANAERTVFKGVFTPKAGFSGAGSVSVANNAFTDLGNRPNSNADGAETDNTFNLTLQGAPVTLVISSNKTSLKAGETATLTFTFSGTPTGFAAADITTSGGTLSGLQADSSGLVYTATFTPNASAASGQASVSVVAGSYTGAGGNLGEGDKLAELSFDTLAPTLKTLNPEDGGYFAAGNALVATFTEKVTAGTGNIRLVDDTTGTTVTLSITNSAIVIDGDKLTLTPSTALVAGHNYHLNIDSTALLDSAGNAYAGIANATNWNFTASNLSTTLNAVTGDNRINAAEESSADPIVITGKISSVNPAVLGALQASDIVVKVTVPRDKDSQSSDNKVIFCTGVTYDSSTGEWTATLPDTWLYANFDIFGQMTGNTPQDTLINGETDIINVTITGRTGTAAAGLSTTLTDTMTVDLSNPAQPTLSLAGDTGTSNSDKFTRNGLINVGALEAGASWEYSLDNGGSWLKGSGTSFAVTQEGESAVQVRQVDAAGNESLTRDITLTLDTQAKAPVVNDIATDNRINLSEATSAITGTAEAGASVSLVVGTNTRTVTANASGEWSYTLVAGDLTSMGQGDETISVSQTDKAGNTSAASKAVVVVDTVRPTVTLVNTGSATLGAGQSTTFTATLSERAPDFSSDSFTVSGGQISNLKADSTGLVYTGTFTPDDNSTTAGSIQLAAGAVADAAGNTNAGASNALALSVNTVRPTVAITSNVTAGTALHAGDTATVTFTLSASSSDFTAADLTVIGGTLSNWTTVSGTSYTATYTPDANSKAPGSVSVASATFANAAANTNADGVDDNNRVDFAIATVRPSLTISSDVGTLGGGQTAVISFKFSEDPGTSFVVGDISTTDGSSNVTGTLSDFKGQGTSYTALFTPTAGFAGAASITVASGAYTNADGSLGLAATSPALTLDALAPTVAMTRSASGTLGAGQTDTITFEFSEAPGESFNLADLDVGGGTLISLSAVSETRYVATFTPEANAAGTAKISLASGRFSDKAGNSNADGSDSNNTLAIAYATAVVTAGSVSATDVPSLFLHKDTGSNTHDNITNNGVIDVDGLVAGATWEYTLDGNASSPVWLAGSGTSFTLTTAGIYGALKVRQSAGGVTSNVGSLSGAAVDYRPAYAGSVSLALTRDTGSSSTDDITYDGRVTVSGLAAGDTWEYSANTGLSWTPGSLTTVYGAITIPDLGTAGKDATQNLMVKATDLAGNTAEAKYSFTLDRKNPAAPNVTLTTDPSDGGAIVDATNVESGGSVKYMLNSGALTSTYTPPTAPGNYTLTVVSYDAAGNGEQTDLTFTVAAAGGGPVVLSAIAAGSGGFVINGDTSTTEFSGKSVSAAGDVNGDGLADLIVGAWAANSYGGRSYVVFGTTRGTAIDLTAVAGGTGGFVINGDSTSSKYSGTSVSAAGDVNGDGLADLIVGADQANNSGGRSYVVFGKTTGTGMDLSAVAGGTGGFVINGGSSTGEKSGRSVSAAGDVNGDGLADLIVGAPGANNGGGRSYVVFGTTRGTAIDLTAVAGGSGGFVINGDSTSAYSGTSVSAAGDVNWDGLADLIVGANGANSNGGRSYVVFGKPTGTAMDLSAVAGGTGGFVINGDSTSSTASGASVSAAGDVNGDGLADLIVGAWAANSYGGRSYVVFGTTRGTAIDLTAVAGGSGGFVINGNSSMGEKSGTSVSSAGDVNGDGLADLIVGAYGANRGGGRSYVVFGKTTGTAMDLSAVAGGTGGFVINGDSSSNNSGISVSAAGDVNGDGLADLIVGANNANSYGGRSYVIFGNTTGAFAQTAVDWMGTDGDDTKSTSHTLRTLVAGAGNDHLTAAVDGVLYGGAGKDQFSIGRGMISALLNPMGWDNNTTQMARIDGGSGIDTIALTGSGLTLDLTKIDNQAGANPDGGSRIDSVEAIDLTGTGNNTLTLAVRDVQDMAGMNVYNSGNGWTGLAASVARHQVRVDGDAGDKLNLGSEWSRAGTATYTRGSQTVSYTVYNAGSGAQLLVNTAMSVLLPPIELSAIAAGVGGFVINGQTPGDSSGNSVSSAGDVNGDGFADLIVGAPDANSYGGRSYVVFGKSTGTVELSAVAGGTGGFVINGDSTSTASGASVSAAGDVNGDGLADLIVGAYPANSFGGRSYVVFGKTTGTAMDLSKVATGAGGFVINGDSTSSKYSGASVSAAGDVNGDGLADLIVGAFQANDSDGRSYVVFGKTTGKAMALSAVATGAGGFVINGDSSTGENSGFSVSAAGDVNGDGLADLIVGANLANNSGGRSYVVFGKPKGTVELSAVAGGSGGFVINGDSTSTASGASVSAAGDVNGDGLADLIVGAWAANGSGGRSYVVFGRTTGTVELSAVAGGTGGFVINGDSTSKYSGYSVSAAGDVNGDGLADLIVGAFQANDSGGRSYVVFGKTTGTGMDLSAVAGGAGGFVINGDSTSKYSGASVSAAGDVNGDGLADLIVGAYGANRAGGRSYVIFGNTSGAFGQTMVNWMGTDAADTQSDGGVAQTLVAGAGNDSLTATAASVLYGGAGNDSFTINQAMITALQSPMDSGGNVNQLTRIDGGSGIDKIVLSGTGLTFDLTQVANQAGSNPDGGSRIDSIEKIDLTGWGITTLKLTAKDVLDMGSANLFKVTGRQQLMVIGDAGDVVDLADGNGTSGWTKVTSAVQLDAVFYFEWKHTSLASVYVQSGVVVS